MKCILVTGTLAPNSNFVAQNNVDQRIEEYLAGLHFYASHFKAPIYFLENSTYPIETDQRFAKLFDQFDITLLRFKPSDQPEKGKGYQEFEMLDQAIDQLSDQYSEFVKCTGRYLIKNAVTLTQKATTGCRIDQHLKMKVAITGFFQCNISFYQSQFKGLFAQANDAEGRYIEHVLFDKLQQLNHLQHQIELFASNPQWEGISGSSGASLKRNPIKMMVRNVERKVLRTFKKNAFAIEY